MSEPLYDRAKAVVDACDLNLDRPWDDAIGVAVEALRGELVKIEQSDGAMVAEVRSYGGTSDTVQHWQLLVNGRFIADTSTPAQADLFMQIARRCKTA